MKYYAECQHYELVVGQKFVSLLGQASVFSFTAAAGIFALAERLQVRYPDSLWVAVPSTLGLFMYAVIIIKYFLQVRHTGDIMLKVEKKFLRGEEEPSASFTYFDVLATPSVGEHGRFASCAYMP